MSGQFRQLHPVITYELILDVPVKQIELLIEGRIDIAFVNNGDHSLSRLQNISIVDFLPHAPVARIWFKHYFNKSIPNLDVSCSVESIRAVLKAISVGSRIGVIPSQLMASDVSTLTP